jgi:hypothetical protein
MLKKAFKKEGLLNEFKASVWQSIWLSLLRENKLQQDISTQIVFMENEWAKNPTTLVVEDIALIESIEGIKIDGQLENIELPSRVCTIAFPNNCLFNGHKINGCLISKMAKAEGDACVSNMAKQFGVKNVSSVNGSWEYTADRFTISYRDPYSTGSIVLNISSDKLADILNADSYKDYTEKAGQSSLGLALSPSEAITQFELMRFILGMLVYVSANEKALSSVESLFVDSTSANKKIKCDVFRVNTIRIRKGIDPHYRQMQHEKFYQGKWENWRRGSRFVPVNMELMLVE